MLRSFCVVFSRKHQFFIFQFDFGGAAFEVETLLHFLHRLV